MTETSIQYSGDFTEREARIKVVGVGGGGGNAVNRMVEADVRRVEFVALNTDAQDLRRSKASNRIQIGENLTKGLGVGGDPALGRQAAQESVDIIKEAVADTDLLFITAGMGGGTGTGAAPVVAQVARDNTGALVIGVVTRPFDFEGGVRAAQAQDGIHELRKHVDCLLVIPNDRMLEVVDRTTPASEAYRIADDVLRQAIQGISDVITKAGDINVDFKDVRRIMTQRHLEAASKAITSPMLESAVIDGAKGILVNFTSSRNVRLVEISEAMDYIMKSANTDVFMKYGQAYDETMGEELKITVIATGFPAKKNELISDLSRRPRGKTRDYAYDDFFAVPAQASVKVEEDSEKPAFLRRKAGSRRLK